MSLIPKGNISWSDVLIRWSYQETSAGLLFSVSMPMLTWKPQAVREKKNLLSTLKVAGVFIPLCKFELLTLRQNKKFICFKQCSMPCLRSDIPSLIKCILNFTDVLNLSVVYFASKAVESPLSQLKLSVHFFYILQKPFISLGPVLS